MKKGIYITMILLLSASMVKGQDDKVIENLYRSKVSLEKEKIESPELSKVFTGNFYRITPHFNIGDDPSLFTCTKKIMIIKDGKLIEMASFATNIDQLIKNTFLLRAEADALTLEKAIDAIDPLSDWDQDKKEHLKKDNKWYFVRGSGFGYKQAYIVTTDSNSKITDIDYSREALKTE